MSFKKKLAIILSVVMVMTSIIPVYAEDATAGSLQQAGAIEEVPAKNPEAETATGGFLTRNIKEVQTADVEEVQTVDIEENLKTDIEEVQTVDVEESMADDDKISENVDVIDNPEDVIDENSEVSEVKSEETAESDVENEQIELLGETKEPDYFRFKAIEESGATISLEVKGKPNPINLQYATSSNEEFTDFRTYEIGTGIHIEKDQYLAFIASRTNSTFSAKHENYFYFSAEAGSGKVDVEGNIGYLMDDTNTGVEAKEYCFYYLLAGKNSYAEDTGLRIEDASNLQLLDDTAAYCYQYMFRNCTSLTAAPDINAETLAKSCCHCMFDGCISLTAAPDIKAETLAELCCQYMFDGCISLTTIPELKATTLAEGCYKSMFEDCTALVTVPELSAMNLAKDCYTNMFKGCTSLNTAPELNATVLADSCYFGMFEDCTALVTVPDLPVATLATLCCASMFEGCTSLTTAPELPAETLAESCYSNMFEGCTSLTTAPELPAVTLATSCYASMFEDCTSLTTAPELPATTFLNVEDCYYKMFSGCSNLNRVTVRFKIWFHHNPTNNWLASVSPSGLFFGPDSLFDVEFGPHTIPVGWGKGYTITLASPDNGSIITNKDAATAGDAVEITVTPDTGYRLATISVTATPSGTPSEVSGSDNTYTFIMPESNVTVTASFTAAVDIPSPVTGLVYNGSGQTGVPSGTGYTLTGEKAKNAGAYTATASLASPDTTVWSNGSCDPQPIPYSIAKRPLTITAGSAEKEYDEAPLTCDSYTITSGSLADGEEIETLRMTAESTITRVGTIDNRIDLSSITLNSGDALTDNYDVTLIPGKLKITGKPPLPSSGSSHSTLFTGTRNNPVTNGTWMVNADGSWSFSAGSMFKNTWGYIRYTVNGVPVNSWFYFDKNSKMLSGWQLIFWNGKFTWFYFNEKHDGTFGACQMGGMTPDGYLLNADGSWSGM